MRRAVLHLSPAVVLLGQVFGHPSHQVGHPKADYVGLGIAAFGSWAGMPGAGEAALVAAGVVAAHHRLDIGIIVAVAFAGATLGGVAGWYAGLKGGSAVFSRRGPFRGPRLRALAAGKRFYDRYGPIAVVFTPSWLAGVNHMRAHRYLFVNAASALLWALTLGLGSFYLGPRIGDLVTDAGTVGATLLVAGLVGVLIASVRRRRRGGAGT